MKIRVYLRDGSVQDVKNVEELVLHYPGEAFPTWMADRRTLVLVPENILGFVSSAEGVNSGEAQAGLSTGQS
jgi:hypothetical protein